MSSSFTTRFSDNESDADSDSDFTPSLPDDMKPDDAFATPTITIDASSPNEKQEGEEEDGKDDDKEELFSSPVFAISDDAHKVPGQNYACVSVIKPEVYETAHHGNRKYSGLLFKIRGVFATREEADTWITTNIIPNDPHFDVHLIKCHSWSPLEDDNIDDRVYMDKRIGDIMDAYFAAEHDKKKGLNARIQIDKDEENARAAERERQRFFKQSTNYKGRNPTGRMNGLAARPDSLPDLPASARPMSLDQARSVAFGASESAPSVRAVYQCPEAVSSSKPSDGVTVMSLATETTKAPR